MAQTVADIKAGYEADPQYAVLTESVNGEVVTLSASERDALLTTWATNERQRQLDNEAAAALKELRRQVRLARTRLQQIRDATPPFTNAQRDAATQDIARYLDGLIGVLIDLRLIEATD